MVAIWKAAWASFMFMLFAPSGYALTLTASKEPDNADALKRQIENLQVMLNAQEVAAKLKANVEANQVPGAPMAPDTTYDTYACEPGSSRVFDLRSSEASIGNCHAECMATTSCVLYSGVFSDWCIGCDSFQVFTVQNAATSAAVAFVKATPSPTPSPTSAPTPSPSPAPTPSPLKLEVDGKTQCDVTKGTWQKSAKPPLYKDLKVDGEYRCLRKTSHPEKYMWVPDDCELPPFDARHMQRIVSRRPLLMVGDSLVRNTYESLRMSMPVFHNITFVFDQYFGPACKIIHKSENKRELYQNATDPYEIMNDILRQAEETAGSSYEISGASHDLERIRMGLVACDVKLGGWPSTGWMQRIQNNTIVMFGGGHHFAHRGNIYHHKNRTLEDSGGGIHVEAFRIALANVLHKLEEIRFTGDVIVQTYSPAHFFHGDWDSQGSCNGKTGPENNISVYAGQLGSASFSDVEAVNSMLRSMTSISSKIKVHILDITAMSWGRADAHPGNSSNDSPSKLTKNDCSHWCLPGVPDVWNQALLHMLRSV